MDDNIFSTLGPGVVGAGVPNVHISDDDCTDIEVVDSGWECPPPLPIQRSPFECFMIGKLHAMESLRIKYNLKEAFGEATGIA